MLTLKRIKQGKMKTMDFQFLWVRIVSGFYHDKTNPISTTVFILYIDLLYRHISYTSKWNFILATTYVGTFIVSFVCFTFSSQF